MHPTSQPAHQCGECPPRRFRAPRRRPGTSCWGRRCSRAAPCWDGSQVPFWAPRPPRRGPHAGGGARQRRRRHGEDGWGRSRTSRTDRLASVGGGRAAAGLKWLRKPAAWLTDLAIDMHVAVRHRGRRDGSQERRASEGGGLPLEGSAVPRLPAVLAPEVGAVTRNAGGSRKWDDCVRDPIRQMRDRAPGLA